MTQDEIYQKVSSTLVEALNVDEDQINPTGDAAGRPGRRVDRLPGHRVPPGARVRHQDPARRAVPGVDLPGRPGVRPGRQDHAKGMTELRTKMPYADLTKFEKNPDFDGLRDLFTVDLISRYIQAKVGPSKN